MNTTLAPQAVSSSHIPAVPDTSRFDMYATIHKALRSFMSDTLVRIGRLDVTDPQDMDAALGELDTLLTLCLSHIEHENLFVHAAIEARQPGGAARTGGDHVGHRDAIDALRAEAAALRACATATQPALALRLYHHLALFVAENLQHMHLEESVNNAALWAAYSDAELLEIHHRLLASIGPAEFMLVARWMVPALNPAERAGMLGDMQAQTPPEAFLGVLAGLRPHLDASGWNKLARALSVAPDFMTAGESS